MHGFADEEFLPPLGATLHVTLKKTDDEIKDAFKNLRTRKDVARLLEINDPFLRSILYGRKERALYRHFSIPKSTVGVRPISSPPKNLAILQKKLLRVFTLIHRPKTCVHGFTPNRSVATNAHVHVAKRWVFNLDLEDFFPSIHIGRLIGLLQQKPYSLSLAAAKVISQICFEDTGRLPQGAPTSPIIANMVARPLDTRLQDLAFEHHVEYTRYADDITFSGNQKCPPDGLVTISTSGHVDVAHILREAIISTGFEVNSAKVRLYKNNWRQEVTGLTVNEAPNVIRRYIRDVDTVMKMIGQHGYEAAYRKYLDIHGLPPELLKNRPERLWNVLRGKCAYLAMVKGVDDAVLRRLRWKLFSLSKNQSDRPSALSNIASQPMGGLAGRFHGWHQLVRSLRNSVLFVETKKQNGDKGVGTAFVVGQNIAITAGHVANANITEVYIESTKLGVPKVMSVEHKGLDVGLLYFDSKLFLNTRYFSLRCRLPEIGEEVAAFGFPVVPQRMPSLVVHSGSVESLPTAIGSNIRYIQTAFQSGGGLSGGPLLDRAGFVVGIMTENVFMKYDGESPQRPYGQAMPIEYAFLLRMFQNDFESRVFSNVAASQLSFDY